MKILKKIMLVVVLLSVPGYTLSANSGYMRVSLIEGDVQIKTPDADDWGFASVNTHPLQRVISFGSLRTGGLNSS